MALQASAGLRSSPLPSSSPPNYASAGLRRPADRFALRSSFFSRSLNLFISPSGGASPATAPKFSMRVASKQSYICRDCGFVFVFKSHFFGVFFICVSDKASECVVFLMMTGIYIVIGLHLRSSLIIISALVRVFLVTFWNFQCSVIISMKLDEKIYKTDMSTICVFSS